MSNDYDKAVDTLMKDVKDLRVDMRHVISALQKRAGNYVETAKESLEESVAQRVDQVRDAVSAVEGSCRHTVNGYAAKIGERPVVSLLAALGMGMIVGGLIAKRHH